MDSDGYRWIPVDPNGSRLIRMDPDTNGSKGTPLNLMDTRSILIDPDGFRSIPLDSDGF